jgi:PST family polysaccharide transporter
MATAHKAVSGVAWTIVTGGAARLLGLGGTVVLTHFLAPDVCGDVSAASIAVITANQFSQLGVGLYVIANRDCGRRVIFHATVIHLSLGLFALLGVLALRYPVASWVSAPSVPQFLPGLVLAMAFDRVAFMPERLLARDMSFRRLGISKALAEAALPIVAVTMAWRGAGGMALVYGNIARSTVNLLAVTTAVERREWLEPTRLEWATIKRLAGYGTVVSVGQFTGVVARKWDNMLVSRFYGSWVMGGYNLAYNLADIPAIQVGEQITDVLLASLANVERARRRQALLRALGLIALIMFPLSVGLGAVANTAVSAFLDRRWAEVGPMLMVLAGLSITRPVAGAMSAYMQVRNDTRAAALLELVNLTAIVVSLSTIGRHNLLWACIAVGIAFFVRMLLSMWLVKKTDGIPLTAIGARLWRPLIACAPLVAAVLATRHAFAGTRVAGGVVALAAEIGAGALGYVVGALAVDGRNARELLHLALETLQRRRRAAHEKNETNEGRVA